VAAQALNECMLPDEPWQPVSATQEFLDTPEDECINLWYDPVLKPLQLTQYTQGLQVGIHPKLGKHKETPAQQVMSFAQWFPRFTQHLLNNQLIILLYAFLAYAPKMNGKRRYLIEVSNAVVAKAVTLTKRLEKGTQLTTTVLQALMQFIMHSTHAHGPLHNACATFVLPQSNLL
jgi:hypothetical protein